MKNLWSKSMCFLKFLFNIKSARLDRVTREELSVYYGYFRLVSLALRTLLFISGS